MKTDRFAMGLSIVLLCTVALAGPYQHLPGRRGTFAMPTGTVLAGATVDATATVTGAQTGADCYFSAPSNMDSDLVLHSVVVTSTDTVRVRFRSVALVSLSSPVGTGSVRCFNP